MGPPVAADGPAHHGAPPGPHSVKGSADFRPDAWARVTARLVADIDGLSVEAAERLLTDARVNRPKTLNAVDCYLAITPGGVCDPDSACPAA